MIISIHAPRTGSDRRGRGSRRQARHFNPRSPHGERHTARVDDGRYDAISIHAPRTGSDSDVQTYTSFASRFQSTLPARGATTVRAMFEKAKRNFNPRSPHGELRITFRAVSVHMAFQSTLPARGATPIFGGFSIHFCISIHAPRTGSDRNVKVTSITVTEISIHAPRTGSDMGCVGDSICT